MNRTGGGRQPTSEYESPGWRVFGVFSDLLIIVLIAATLFVVFLMASHKPDKWSQMTTEQQDAYKRQADQSYQQASPQRSGW